MEDPCNECLVKPACTEVCWKKQNYGKLISEAVRRHESYLFRNDYRRTQNLRNKLSYYRSLEGKDRTDLKKIRNRQSGNR
jgi:hypothetical protein